ncbi:MAG: hypothetical protein PUH32_03650, partial [Firmicutes bacterium]|nr:hypothetical protein [Bacillota bacterium]
LPPENPGHPRRKVFPMTRAAADSDEIIEKGLLQNEEFATGPILYFGGEFWMLKTPRIYHEVLYP